MNSDEKEAAPAPPASAIGPIHPPTSGGSGGATAGAVPTPDAVAAAAADADADSAPITVTVATPRRDEAGASDVPTQSLLAN